MSVDTVIEADDDERLASAGGSPVVFSPAADGGGVVVADLVERHRYALSTGDPTPASVDPDDLRFPVDAAVRLRTDHLEVAEAPSLFVRDGDGTMIATTDPPFEQSFPPGEYYLEVCAPIKLYVRVEGSMTVTATVERKRIDLDGEQPMVVGARSKHQRPAATVTTTRDPADVMRAVSTFGSALKTTSPERSFPTLRGHPPAVELGEERSLPEGLAPPDTGVTVEVPPELRYVYPVAPLAYYLGAEVVPGTSPTLVTDAGFTHDLAPGGEFEREVERVLKGTFLLDCLTRTEGFYEVDLHERQAVEPAVDLDFAALYEQPLAERLSAYLSVPYRTLAPQVPDWQLTADVAPDADAVETLPFLVDDLAVVRATGPLDSATAVGRRDDEVREQRNQVDSFLRSSTTRSDAAPETVSLPPADSMEHAWVGEGVSRRADKVTPAAYRNRLERSPADADIEVTVVCNDPGMLDERDAVDEVYGAHGADVDVTVREQLAVGELRATLAGDAEFLHYIGHIDDRGFECTDGVLDAGTLESTGVDAFLLNACTSYEQGMALIEAGAVGGVVTLQTVVNDSAVRIGATTARLLNDGYPLGPALDIARKTSYAGGDYVVVGDGSHAVARASNANVHLYRVDRVGDQFDLEIVSYSSVTGGIGSMFTPYVAGNEAYYLNAGSIGPFRVDEAELEEYLDLFRAPVEMDGKIRWSEDFD